MLRPTYSYADIKYEISQHDLDESGCVYIAALTQIGNNHNIILTEDQIRTLLENRPKAIGGNGSRPDVALPKLLHDLNIIHPHNLSIQSKRLGSGMVTMMMKKGWMFLVSGYVTSSYVKDIKDGTLDGIWSLQGGSFKHMRCMHYYNNSMYITETAYGNLPYNTFPVSNWQDLVKAGRLQATCYVIV